MKTCTTCGAEWPDDTKFCPSDGSPLRVAEGTSLIGSIVKNTYHIIEKLGEGGMGAVYLGEHVKMGRKSAIKVLTESLAQDQEAIARFNREASNASRINHPNVCGIYDFGETEEGLIFLAMEYIEGESLTEMVQREGPLGPYRAAKIVHQVGSALQAAHDLGIVHRDLKPDNIMITRARDGSDVVKVVDFGIAKAMGGEEGQKVTRTGLVVGTPEYMSPEQLSGDKLDGRSDTYSLALVLFRMLTGRLPFEAHNAQEVMIKRLTDDPLRLNDAMDGANFPAQLQQVLDRALQRMPGDRYSSAEEFTRDAVQAVSGGQAPPSFDTEGATQMMDSGPADRSVTEQLQKTRVSGSKPTLPMDQAATPRSPTPETPLPRTVVSTRPKKKKPVAVVVGSLAVVAVGAGAVALAMSGRDQQQAGSEDSLQVLANTPMTSIDTGSSQSDPTRGAITPGTQTDPGEQGNVGGERPAVGDTTARVENPPAVINSPTANADSIRIEGQITDLIDPLIDGNPQVLGTALSQARQLFADPLASPIQRAQLAFMLAGSFRVQGVADSACAWTDRALTLDPGNTRYQQFRRNNCTP